VEWRSAAWATALAAASLLLSGCADGAGVPQGIPRDEHGDALPTIQGTVVDGAIRPLAGAVVRFLDSDVNGTTDETGHYEIRRPTAQAESILVTASKAGFVPLTHQVQVSGSLSAKADFILSLDGDLVPHSTVEEHRGVLRCRAGLAAAGQSTGVQCEADHRVDDVVAPWIWEINPTPNLAGAVVEVYWDAMTPASETLHAWLRLPMVGGQGGQVVVDVTGPSPLRLEVPADLAQAMGRWEGITLYVDLAEQEGGTPGFATDQAFDAYASLFYIDPPPAGYRLP
jgi:Carboxypeptidase regulatory-like domain